MRKQTRSRRSDNHFAKGKVTPIQVAFIVDRYLCDNNFSETRSIFRTEAASLISNSPVNEAPKSLLSLMAMLNEYICLKEEKVMQDQERARLDQEKFRVQTLLHGMQDVMNAYNGSSTMPAIQAPSAKPMVVVPQSVPSTGSPSGCQVHNTPTVIPVPLPSNTVVGREDISPTVTNFPLTRKRAGSKALSEAPAKKSRSKLPTKRLPNKDRVLQVTQSNNAVTTQHTTQTSSVIQLSPHNRAPNECVAQGSSVAKSLFMQTSLTTPTNSSVPNTPPQPVSSQGDKSPLGNSFIANGSANSTPQEITPTNCTVISSERIRVSPYKQMAFYSVERNRCISSSPIKANLKRLNKRDHVKGRLDFDGSDVAEGMDKPITNEISASELEKEADLFDVDLPNLDAFGANFSFSELFVDFDLDSEGINYACEPALDACASVDNVSGSSHESREANLVSDQVVSEYSSTVTEVLSGKDVNADGPDTLTAVTSVTKCIRILSPAKGCRSSLHQENFSARN